MAILATLSPDASTWPTSLPALYTAEGSRKAELCEDKDTTDSTSESRGIQADSTAFLNLPSRALQSMPVPSAPDTAAVGPSQPE